MKYLLMLLVLIAAFVGVTTVKRSESAPALPPLTLHLPLIGDAEDRVAQRKIKITDVEFTSSGAKFNGATSYLRMKRPHGVDFGKDDFTIAIWVQADDQGDDNVGDILSYYSEDSLRGLNLSVDSRSGMTSSQANYRNLSFGINGGDASPPLWRNEGRPGAAVQIAAITVFEGSLYVGTMDFGPEGGRVYRYIDVEKWEDMKFPRSSNMVSTLAEHRGRLCGGTHTHRWGSPLRDQADATTETSGKVYCYDPKNKEWQFLGVPDQPKLDPSDDTPPSPASASAFTTFRGDLYMSPAYTYGVYRWREGRYWDYVGTPRFEDLSPPAVRVMSMAVWNGSLYAALNDSGGVAYLADNHNWINIGLHALQNYSLSVHRGELIVGTFETGEVFSYSTKGKWRSLGRLGNEDEVMALTVFNGTLYGGTLPNGEVYRYQPARGWTRLTQLDGETAAIGDIQSNYENGALKRVWNFAVYQGRIFAGTLPSGKVFSTSVGQVVTEDRSLKPGWHHITAVRERTTIRLYRDGKLIGSSSGADVANITVKSPLLIGKGSGDLFKGTMKDLRIYKASLGEQEIAHLATSTH